MRRPVVPSRSRARASTSRTSFTVAETADSSSNAAPVEAATIRASVVLPAARRPVEDRRADAVLLDREPQRRALAEHVRLADELVRACAGRSRCASGATVARALAAASEKRSLHARSMLGRAVRDEVTDLLSRLIRVDTTNPPGNETAAAELLRDYLEANGLECELYRAGARAREPRRAHPRHGDGPSLLLLGHTDVVLADPAEWSVPPFSGEVRDGEVWGRGALDMKSQVAANAVAIASLAREGFRPTGDLIFAATADEEVGDGFGLEWLCEAHPDAVRCDFAINEGGGDRLELEDGAPIYAADARRR